MAYLVRNSKAKLFTLYVLFVQCMLKSLGDFFALMGKFIGASRFCFDDTCLPLSYGLLISSLVLLYESDSKSETEREHESSNRSNECAVAPQRSSRSVGKPFATGTDGKKLQVALDIL